MSINVFNSQSWSFKPYVSLCGQKGYVPIVAHTSFPSPPSHTTHVDVDPRQATINMALVSRPRYRHCFLRRRASPRSTMVSRGRERHQERKGILQTARRTLINPTDSIALSTYQVQRRPVLETGPKALTRPPANPLSRPPSRPLCNA